MWRRLSANVEEAICLRGGGYLCKSNAVVALALAEICWIWAWWQVGARLTEMLSQDTVWIAQANTEETTQRNQSIRRMLLPALQLLQTPSVMKTPCQRCGHHCHTGSLVNRKVLVS